MTVSPFIWKAQLCIKKHSLNISSNRFSKENANQEEKSSSGADSLYASGPKEYFIFVI